MCLLYRSAVGLASVIVFELASVQAHFDYYLGLIFYGKVFELFN